MIFPRLILGSTSKRRKELLTSLKIPYEIEPSHFDETSIPFRGDPESYVLELALQKSFAIKKEDLILTADTAVFCEERMFGKPKNLEEAKEMLSFLSGKKQEVWTGVTLRRGSQKEEKAIKTLVFFTPLTSQQIDNYLSHIVWQDKSGSYTLEGKGAFIVKKIEGCFYNVLGLPLSILPEMFLSFGIDLWNF